MPETLAAPTARVFFALWPDAQVRAGLMRQGLQMHSTLGGKLTHADSVHLTLVFLGEVGPEQLPRLQTRASSVRFAPFVLCIDRAGCWRHNSIGWVAPQQTPAQLQHLVDALESALGEEGFEFDHRAYAAHITLLRKARCAPMEAKVPAIEWPVREFVLMRSELHSQGSRYSTIGRWAAHEEDNA